MRLSGATESAVNHSKQMKRGAYERGRKIIKPPPVFSNGAGVTKADLRLGAGSVIRFGLR
jgi:hypothetical protein